MVDRTTIKEAMVAADTAVVEVMVVRVDGETVVNSPADGDSR